MITALILIGFVLFIIAAIWSLSKFQFSDDNDYNNEQGTFNAPNTTKDNNN